MIKRKWLFAAIALALSAGCQTAAPEPTVPPTVTATSIPATLTQTPLPSNTPVPFELSSPAFENRGFIPKQFACTGVDISPELIWGDPPAGTKSFVLFFEDRSTGSLGWLHWAVYNLPAVSRGLPEAVSRTNPITGGGQQGQNSWGLDYYRGPCPPEGITHNYLFVLTAVDIILDLEEGASSASIANAMKGHVLAQIDLHVSFTR